MQPAQTNATSKVQQTVPKHVLDRIENEWRQMRETAASAKPAAAAE